jgi:hypothetical protein
MLKVALGVGRKSLPSSVNKDFPRRIFSPSFMCQDWHVVFREGLGRQLRFWWPHELHNFNFEPRASEHPQGQLNSPSKDKGDKSERRKGVADATSHRAPCTEKGRIKGAKKKRTLLDIKAR